MTLSKSGDRPLIINLAPTGMVPTRTMSSLVPLQPEEIVADVVAASSIGLTSVHLHARDEHDEPTHKREYYARIIGGIRERCPDLVICVSCSGRKALQPEERAEVLDLPDDVRPDMASLTLSSLNFPRQASVNAPDTIAFLAQRMRDRGIAPEIEIFDLGMTNVLSYLQQRNLVPRPCYANLLFGNLSTAQASLLHMGAVAAGLPADCIWSLAGLGASQLRVAACAVGFADGVRIGLEDNLWLDAGRSRLASNCELIERVHRMADAVGRPVMASTEMRRVLQWAPTGQLPGSRAV